MRYSKGAGMGRYLEPISDLIWSTLFFKRMGIGHFGDHK